MKSKTKHYLYNFVGGGWNSEHATTKRSAIKQAKKRWANDPQLVVDEDSFRISTEQDLKNLLSLFY